MSDNIDDVILSPTTDAMLFVMLVKCCGWNALVKQAECKEGRQNAIFFLNFLNCICNLNCNADAFVCQTND